MDIFTPVENLHNVGPVYKKRLKRLGIKTVQDLLYHFPHKYEDFSNVKKIAEARTGEQCSLQGKILEIESSRTWKKKMSLTTALLGDEGGALKIVWFNQPYLVKMIKQGDFLSLSGKILQGKDGAYLSNPSFEKMYQGEENSLTHTARIISIYPQTENLSSRWLRYIIKAILAQLGSSIKDPLPEEIKKEYGFPGISKALWQIHFPDSLESAEKAKERFSFENLFFLELAILRYRMKLSSLKAPQLPISLKHIQRFTESLPFKLTDSQRKSAWQILKDSEKPRPMNRLLQGDVGSGKTVVAAIAVLNAVKNGYQAVLMAPTEVLVKQHFNTIWKLLNNFKMDIGLLTGKEDKFFSKKLKTDSIEISRKKLLEKAKEGEIDFLIGTHALIQGGGKRSPGIRFKNLALAVVDEQHRFGVEQRAKLLADDSSGTPHLLSMTATPIPRTLALTVYGDLDLSLITELPKGRKKIITKIVLPEEREKTYQFIKKEVKKGRQVFVLCPRIDPGQEIPEEEKMQGWAEVRAVKEEYEKLSKEVFPEFSVGMMHGKLPSKEKERIMKDFSNPVSKRKKIDILVSTSVIEVGIDVPNATVMMIEGADRFGLAQLHQFRGRVGRSKYQSYCFLFSDSPGKKTEMRLKALVDTDSGFKLAEKDLEIRGPGDFIGIRQSGIADLAMKSLGNVELIEKTRKAAKEIIEKDHDLRNHPVLREKADIFQKMIHLE